MAADLAEIDGQIKRIYEDADYVGSLVADGRTGRPTEHKGERQEPEDWGHSSDSTAKTG